MPERPLHVELAEIPDLLAEVGLKNQLHLREHRRRVPLEPAGVFTALVAHSQRQVVLYPLDGNE